MTPEKWLIHPGETRVIDLDDVRAAKIGLVGGQVDVVVHDEPGMRIEVHSVTVKDLRIEVADGNVEIDHPQLRWDNFLEVFRNFGSGGPAADVSVAVPRTLALTLGVVSAGALVSGLEGKTRLNTVSGDIIVDGHRGELAINSVSGDVQIRDLDGGLNANSVSGDIAVTGRITEATVDTVSGAVLIDAHGPVHRIGLNSVSGDGTIRLDARHPANYVVRSASGRVQLDGEVRSGKGGPITNYVGSRGELSGAFVDLRANSVSGDLTIVRRTGDSEDER
ncbi:DUF4097 family beta strand repeat-containing protein [Microbacterium sp. SORGH_AS_0888]|uniref:DUF4097 family beta strand repeat-containing protein n=1 Tax=Microbacterium sp. SORGH_AS_0888 TaxID=3041791 RepID=UPI0027858AD9|nr:DUF4097 family beta strand repeat-containing protein [Microbacterium sp. SORGH_AS_0888]MDQ1130138.1 DUF4097 and DUF4098 domain-containing protein YvlB [Microbacterium sp. SORGH_AS_0888]